MVYTIIAFQQETLIKCYFTWKTNVPKSIFCKTITLLSKKKSSSIPPALLKINFFFFQKQMNLFLCLFKMPFKRRRKIRSIGRGEERCQKRNENENRKAEPSLRDVQIHHRRRSNLSSLFQSLISAVRVFEKTFEYIGGGGGGQVCRDTKRWSVIICYHRQIPRRFKIVTEFPR